MANNKKPRKKYHPRRSLLQGTRGKAPILAMLATSNEQIDTATIDSVIAPFQKLVDCLKDGTTDDQIFYDACAAHYLHVALIEVLRHTKIKADEETDMMVRLELSIKLETATDVTPDILTAIGERNRARNKWIATGDELKHLESAIESFYETMQLASWQHYVAAVKESEPILDAAIWRQKKKHAAQEILNNKNIKFRKHQQREET